MRLDVGCGHKPEGDVNVDLHPEPTGHRSFDQRFVGKALNTKKILNFVQVDGNFLPFSDNIFDEVYSSHTIEHNATPFRFLSELVRVSKNKIKVICPHRYSKRRPLHISVLNGQWFRKALLILNVEWFETTVIGYRQIPNRYYLPYLFRFPNIIEVNIRK